MTYDIHEFYCRNCKAPTPHEVSEDGQRARCITCLNKDRTPHELKYADDTARHIAALDGFGNRGEKERKK
jgi:hypothetical protein